MIPYCVQSQNAYALLVATTRRAYTTKAILAATAARAIHLS